MGVVMRTPSLNQQPKPVRLTVNGKLMVTLVRSWATRAQIASFNKAVRVMKDGCTVTNPKYIAMLRAGRSPWGVKKRLELYSYVPGKDETTFVTDRGAYSWIAKLIDDARLPFVVIDSRIRGKKFRPVPHLMMNGKALNFRPDQEPIIGSIHRSVTACGIAGQQGIIAAPPGTGKTIIAAEVIRMIGLKSAIVVHTRHLAEQWQAVVKNTLGIDAVIVGAGNGWRENAALECPVVVCMMQTAMRNMYKWERLMSATGLLIIDEAHHSPAMSWRKLAWLAPCRYRFGFTATPKREDGLTKLLHNVCGKIIVSAKVENVRLHGGVVPVLICPYVYSPNNYNNNFPGSWMEFTNMINSPERNRKIAALAKNASSSGNVLIMTTRIKHAIDLLAVIPGAEGLYGGMPGGRNGARAALARVRAAKSGITVATVNIIGEGIDVPGWTSGIAAAPWSSEVATTQRLGRLTRPLPGKDWAYMADIIDDTPMGWSSWKKRKRAYKKGKMRVDKIREL